MDTQRVSKLRSALAAALAFTIAASGSCGSDKSAGHDEDGGDGPSGTYTLRRVDGADLPKTIYSEGDADFVTITAGRITLDEVQKTFTGSVTFGVTQNGQSTNESLPVQGTYQRSGSTVTLTTSGGGVLPGTQAGNILSVRLDISDLNVNVTLGFTKDAPISGDITGVYALRQVNDRVVTGDFAGGLFSDRLSDGTVISCNVMTGSLQLTADGAYDLQVTVRCRSNTGFNSSRGTFRRSGAAVSFTAQREDLYPASFTGAINADGGVTVDYDLGTDRAPERLLFRR